MDFLRGLLKDKEYIYLAYMTGILPIKKYGTHSALNMFNEFSMTNPGILAEFVGFTEQEVEKLCQKYNRNLEELKEWYDGYHFDKEDSVYNPRSVVQAVLSGICDTYWNRTETFEALRMYIDMNYEGLKDDVLSMLAVNKKRSALALLRFLIINTKCINGYFLHNLFLEWSVGVISLCGGNFIYDILTFDNFTESCICAV